MIRQTLKLQGRETVFWERNPHGSRTMVMMHGFRGSHTGLTDMVQHFDGFRLILPDLPGYGESPALEGTHTLERFAAWLDDLAEALDLRDWISWGHSYSSSSALIQAATGRRRPSALISVSMGVLRQDWASLAPTFYYGLGHWMPYALQRRWVASRLVDHATGRWLFQTVSAERRRELVKRGDKNLPRLNPRVVTEHYFSALHTKLEPYAAAANLPVLMIAGAKDVIVPLRRLERLVSIMPDGTLVVMEDQGHLAPIERPVATATLTKRFINGLAVL